MTVDVLGQGERAHSSGLRRTSEDGLTGGVARATQKTHRKPMYLRILKEQKKGPVRMERSRCKHINAKYEAESTSRNENVLLVKLTSSAPEQKTLN